MNRLKSTLFIFALSIYCVQFVSAQGFLHREGKYIFDGSGNEVILRGIGTGNWMLQEGYMMQSSGVAGAQHEFREKLIETIGEEKTDSFYTAWLHSHFTRTDVDSMKSWGFNSVRVAIHYKWFTPPIEDEPVPGEVTWLDTGFSLIDSLLNWCGNNEMYLILDLHGAPGGQGKETNISDYDPSKPSLWESRENKDKTIALWKKLAERYSTEPWMGGYDLINEPNWSFSGGNAPLWNLYKEITSAIREVDQNHLIIIEGNWFSNDYSGLPAIWDNNMALSFHKYWTYNDENSLDWMLDQRNARNVPIWLGESGENSNTWFTNLIKLCEENRIGWSWWPVKKPGINNPLLVKVNEDYQRLINYWKGTATNPGEEGAFNAVLQFAENHRIENCTFMRDVVDAMIRQPRTTETIPYKKYKTGEPVFATDYNLGRNGYAYFDNDTANYHGSTNNYTAWNQGWSYRNDGVDIETTYDADTTNGFNVGWTGDGEWLEYTLDIDSTAAYSVDIRSASGVGGAKVYFEMDGTIISPVINLPGTSGWSAWRTTTANDILLEKGTHNIRLIFEQGGSNINYFKFYGPDDATNVAFSFLNAESSDDGNSVIITLNKPITNNEGEIDLTDFNISINGSMVAINSIDTVPGNQNKLLVNLEEPLFYGGNIRISYTGNSVLSNGQQLEQFSNMQVGNNLPRRFTVPRRIQSEDFHFNNGLVVESCTDIGGGYNMGYAAPGDYLDYLIHVPEAGNYTFNFRVATIRFNNQLVIQYGNGNTLIPLDTVSISPTGGWQKWETVSTTVYLEEGRFTLRLYVRSGEFNTNWFQVEKGPAVGVNSKILNALDIYPNPANEFITVKLPENTSKNKCNFYIYNTLGQLIKTVQLEGNNTFKIDVSDLETGHYIIDIQYGNGSHFISKVQIR